MKIPDTTSELIESDNRRVVDLSADGISEIPVLGMNRSVQTTEGSIFHRHSACMEITCCVRGSVKFDCGGRAYTLLPGMVFVSKPRDVHRLRMNPKGAKVFWMFLRWPKADESLLGLDEVEGRWLLRELATFPCRAFAAPDGVRVLFERLFAIIDLERRGSVSRRVKLRTTALQILTDLVEAGHRKSTFGIDARFRVVIDRMRRDPSQAFSKEDLIRELGCSPNTILSRFRRFTGLPPQAFLMKCRIRRAEDLLKDRTRSITDIAAELGFASSQHFATRFRQETGKTPRDWRRG